ncbi:Tissue alpha-L-fucosidase [Sparganum proliferum]
MWKGPTPDPAAKLYMDIFYPSGFAYADFAKQFRAEFFDPHHWADIFHASGAKYVVLTSKHHEGFCNWPSSTSWNWNAVDVGPRRDLVGELAQAIRSKTGMQFGVYHSLFEWFNPLYLADVSSNHTKQSFVDQKTMPELYDLVERYRPSVIWSDGSPGTSDYWKAKEFLAWLYNDSPVKDFVVANDRWGSDVECKHGDFLTCADRYHPTVLPKKKWESCVTLDKYSWGFRRNSRIQDYLTNQELIETLVETIAFGGNFLINVGPTAWGTIEPIFEERLLTMGDWLSANGMAIYDSVPWTVQKDPKRPKLWYTKQRPKATSNSVSAVYALFADWPAEPDHSLLLSAVKAEPGKTPNCTLLAFEKAISVTAEEREGGLLLSLPAYPPERMQFVWVVRLENVQERS